MNKLTVAIITFNEEANIARCLDSVKEVADEILVVDSFSTDKTEEICHQYGVRFIKNPFAGHIEQKNFALANSKFEYVLSLDADEALTPELILEIKRVKQNPNFDGYSFNRLNNYCGHWVKHCGWYPDTKLRLVKKTNAQWIGTNPHDFLNLKNDSPIYHLNGDLLHYSYNSISSHILQTDKFTSIAARASFNQGKRSNIFLIISRPFFQFFRDYIIKLGFLDGRYGFIICFINAVAAMLKYAKLFDLQLGRKI
jgi:glycosyltransferase involved in cell wall biosynthesis